MNRAGVAALSFLGLLTGAVALAGTPDPTNDPTQWTQRDCTILTGDFTWPPGTDAPPPATVCGVEVEVTTTGDACQVVTSSVPGVIFAPPTAKLIIFRLAGSTPATVRFKDAPLLPGGTHGLAALSPVLNGRFVAIRRVQPKNRVVPYTLEFLRTDNSSTCQYGPLIVNRE